MVDEDGGIRPGLSCQIGARSAPQRKQLIINEIPWIIRDIPDGGAVGGAALFVGRSDELDVGAARRCLVGRFWASEESQSAISSAPLIVVSDGARAGGSHELQSWVNGTCGSAIVQRLNRYRRS